MSKGTWDDQHFFIIIILIMEGEGWPVRPVNTKGSSEESMALIWAIAMKMRREKIIAGWVG